MVIDFNLRQLDLAATRADELAEDNDDKVNHKQSKLIRDKAYTYLEELVDEIREAGKYVFRKDENRLKGYSSQYRRRHRKVGAK